MIKPVVHLFVASAFGFWVGQSAVAPQKPACELYMQAFEHVPRAGQPGYATFRAVNVLLEEQAQVTEPRSPRRGGPAAAAP